MNIKKLNNYKSKVLNYFTNFISKNNKIDSSIKDKNLINKILVVRPNHRLGNQLLITPLVQELQNHFPNATIELFLKGNLGKIIFKEYKNVKVVSLPKKHFKHILKYLFCWMRLIFKKYDLVINTVEGSSSGRIATKIVRAKNKIYSNPIKIKRSLHMAHIPIIALRSLLEFEFSDINNDNDFPKLDIKLTDNEIEKGHQILEKLVNNKSKVIGLYTVATAAKEYPSFYWDDLYTTIKKELPDFEVIEILPDNNRSNINVGIPSFLSNDVREIAGLLDNLTLFISGDCGIMHLAAATSVPTIGLFKVTNKEAYKPYGNDNIAIDTNEFNIQDIVKTAMKIITK
jgi:heptosyltransferase III